MSLSPIIAIHMTAALAAVVTGPIAIWTRKGHGKNTALAARPKLHRAFGYAWVTLMLLAATSAIFISAGPLGHLQAGGLSFSFIHLFIPATYIALFIAFRALARGDIITHQRTMKRLYFGACLVAGGFTFMPGRFMHQWLMSVI